MFFLKKRGRDEEGEDSVMNELPSLAMDIISQRNQAKAAEATNVAVLNAKSPLVQPSKDEQTRGLSSETNNDEEGYFASLLKELDKENKDIREDIASHSQRVLEGNLLENMKEEWEKRKKDLLFSHEEDSLRSKIIEKIESLKNLEGGWQSHHLEVIKCEEELRKQELELKRMFEEFRELCRRHVRNFSPHPAKRKVLIAEPSRIFVAKNGEKIVSTTDLMDFIKSLDATAMKEYVNNSKNDFANWIRFAFNDEALANKMLVARSKKDMLAAFE